MTRSLCISGIMLLHVSITFCPEAIVEERPAQERYQEAQQRATDMKFGTSAEAGLSSRERNMANILANLFSIEMYRAFEGGDYVEAYRLTDVLLDRLLII